MKFPLLLAALIGVIAPAHAQRPSARVPVLQPHVAVLGDAPTGDVGAAALSPNSRLIAYGFGRGNLAIWNTKTHEQHVLVTGPVHVHHWSPKGDAIVFQAHRGPLVYQENELTRDGGIWTIRVDPLSGKALEPPHLVAMVPVNHGVPFSPDASMIAMAQYHGSYISSLAVVPASGGTPRILASGIEVSGVQWAADGSAVYFKTFPNSSSSVPTVYRAPVNGGIPVPVHEDRPVPPGIAENVWSVSDPATGRLAAYSAFPGDVAVSDWHGLAAWPGRSELAGVRKVSPRGLRVVNLADRTMHDLIDTTSEVVAGPDWSATNRIAVIVRQGGRLALHLQDADGRHARTFALRHHFEASDLHISPDSRYAAFRSRVGGYGTIEIVELASGLERTLRTSADDFGDASGPEGMGLGQIAWNADSKRILYLGETWTATPSLHEVTLAGTDRTLRTLPQFNYGRGPLFLVTAKAQSFVEFAGAKDQDGIGAVTLVPISGALPRVVFAEPAMGGPLSPDGRLMAIQSTGPNGRQGTIALRLVAPDGTGMRTVPLPFLARPGVTWHPDGQRLLMLGREAVGGTLSIYSVPITTAAPTTVAPVGSEREGATLAVSPDGRFVAVTRSGTPRATFVKLSYDVVGIFRSARK